MKLKLSAEEVIENMVVNLREICENDGDELARLAEILYFDEDNMLPNNATFDMESDTVTLVFDGEEGVYTPEEAQAIQDEIDAAEVEDIVASVEK